MTDRLRSQDSLPVLRVAVALVAHQWNGDEDSLVELLADYKRRQVDAGGRVRALQDLILALTAVATQALADRPEDPGQWITELLIVGAEGDGAL